MSINNKSSIFVSWYTKDLAPYPIVEYWSEDSSSSAQSIIPETNEISGYYVYVAELTNLKFGHNYNYQVRSDNLNKRAVMNFHIPSESNEKNIKFIIWGDTRTGRNIRKELAEEIVEKFDIDFVLHTGDIVQDGRNQKDWNDYFDDTEILNRNIPGFYTQGNHEAGSSSHMFKNIPLGFKTNFNGYYTFNWNQLNLLILNSNLQDSEQKSWMIKEIEESKDITEKNWKITLIHYPVFTYKTQDTFEYWATLFGDHVNDLVFAGHNHNYARTYPINQFLQGDNKTNYNYYDLLNPICIITGGGGAPIKIMDDQYESMDSIVKHENTYHAILVEIIGNYYLKLESWGFSEIIDLYLIDNITITKI